MGVADIGYAVAPDSRGAGLATAAVRLLSAWLAQAGFGPAIARVQCDHSVENPASCRVAVAAGFAREGVRRGFLPLRESGQPQAAIRRHDVCMHGLLAIDLTPARRVRAGVIVRDCTRSSQGQLRAGMARPGRSGRTRPG